MNLAETFSLTKLLHLDKTEVQHVAELNLLQEMLQKDISHSSNNFTFGANAEAGISIKLFNDPTDDNEEDLADRLGFDNLVNENTFIKNNLHGRLKASTIADLNQISINFQADQNISLECYLKHDPQEKLLGAVKNDIKDFKVLFDKSAGMSLKNFELSQRTWENYRSTFIFNISLTMIRTSSYLIQKC